MAPETAAAILKAMGHPLRYQIVTMLLEESKSVGEIEDETGAHQANVSQHLKELRTVGIVGAERSGTTKYYSIAPERLDTVQAIVGAL